MTRLLPLPTRGAAPTGRCRPPGRTCSPTAEPSNQLSHAAIPTAKQRRRSDGPSINATSAHLAVRKGLDQRAGNGLTARDPEPLGVRLI